MVRINIISAKLDMSNLFLPFVDIQYSFPSHFAQKVDMSSWKHSKLSNQALSGTMENWTPEEESKLVSSSSGKEMWNAWRLKLFKNKIIDFAILLLFWEKKTPSVFKMISLFIIFVCDDSKQLLYCLYRAIFHFLCGKMP